MNFQEKMFYLQHDIKSYKLLAPLISVDINPGFIDELKNKFVVEFIARNDNYVRMRADAFMNKLKRHKVEVVSQDECMKPSGHVCVIYHCKFRAKHTKPYYAGVRLSKEAYDSMEKKRGNLTVSQFLEMAIEKVETGDGK